MPDFSDVKLKTHKLYESLPQNKNLRMERIDIRDQVIELNYRFFEYVASHTYVKNRYIEYEDKVQTCLLSFCSIWWKYLWDGTGDDKCEGFRTDLAFTTFFKPRLSEMIDRELTEVKYHVYRALKMRAAEQVGKHWSKLEYEDLSKVDLPAKDIIALKAIFKSDYISPIEDQQYLLAADPRAGSKCLDRILEDDNYSSACDFLIREIIRKEDVLSDSDLANFASMYGIPLEELERSLPSAYTRLQLILEDEICLHDVFINNA